MHRSLIFAAVSGSLPASSPAIGGAQTLSELRGIAAKWNINRFAYTLFDFFSFFFFMKFDAYIYNIYMGCINSYQLVLNTPY